MNCHLTILLAAALLVAPPAFGNEGKDAPAKGAPLRPLMVGKTTLDEAAAAWHEAGAHPRQSGNLAIGSGSGADALGRIALEQVLLVDVEGVDFEGFQAARYGFVDGVLYSVQVTLGLDVSKKKSVTSMSLSSAELDALEARLRKEYGKPAREGRDLFAGKRPNILLWRVGQEELILSRSLQSFLRLESPSLSKKVVEYRKAACRQHDQGHKIKECW